MHLKFQRRLFPPRCVCVCERSFLPPPYNLTRVYFLVGIGVCVQMEGVALKGTQKMI